MLRVLAFLCVACIILAWPAFPQAKPTTTGGQTFIGASGGWAVYSFKDSNQTVCYMSLTAKPNAVKNLKRGVARLMVTHRPAENSQDVINYMGGYNFKPGSSAIAQIGKTRYDLFTSKDGAWARDPATDHAIAAAIQKNPALTMTGTPLVKNSTPVVDHFDLTGAGKAYQMINKACGYDTSATVPAAKKKAAAKR